MSEKQKQSYETDGLNTDVRFLKGVGATRAQKLGKLGIHTFFDLLLHLPRGYDDQSTVTPIASLPSSGKATVLGRITNVAERRARNNLSIITAYVRDDSGAMQITWFGKKYLKDKLKTGSRIFASGSLSYAYYGMGQIAMNRVDSFVILADDETAPCEIVPIYASTESVSQTMWRKIMGTLLDTVGELPEILPPNIVRTYNLMERGRAFRVIHFPENIDEIKKARERIAFEELLLIQCGLFYVKQKSRLEKRGIKHDAKGELTAALTAKLPFSLTGDQQRTWADVCADMEKIEPMRRLVQGDVGSGKTIIAALALAKAVENGCQGAFMAPTEILAAQHFETFRELFAELPVKIGFLSGRMAKGKRDKICAAIKNHELDIVIGTHALIQKDVAFARLGLAVTDEQHRFGVEQRAALEQKGQIAPDILVMTATPIPRTMTLTLYGDLEVSLIREMPPGRLPVRTFLRGTERRGLIYDYVQKKVGEGRQAYVVCPRIESAEDDTSNLPSVEDVYEELRTTFLRGVNIGLLHGKMKPAEKEKVMEDFAAGLISVLVATTVIEVGINVPNATLMIVEHAERFGLSQLHQLRGRVGRGRYRSFCILISDAKNAEAKERLKIMEETADGFLLAEKDLELRGPGQFFGNDQHGLGDLKAANVLRDTDILIKARKAAAEIAADRQELKNAIVNLKSLYGGKFFNIQNY